MPDIKPILTQAIEKGASDLHINVGMPPVLRRNTELIITDFPVIGEEDAKQMVLQMVGKDRFKKLEETRDLDFSTTLDDGNRFRVNAHYQRETIGISFRVIPNEIPLIDSLNLPPIVKDLAELPRGLVLVTGHTGSGKSTTLAAMIGLINKGIAKRIITLEDPVEYALENECCMIEQREIGSDCPDFASGLRHVLRQDPDIIMVGEMRD
ncbi:MAG: type IV pilus twitching motility protein PilT, partial [Planctomycetota bacterium]